MISEINTFNVRFGIENKAEYFYLNSITALNAEALEVLRSSSNIKDFTVMDYRAS